MAELEALSKLKMAGKLHYWRGTIEIDEHELHARVLAASFLHSLADKETHHNYDH